MILLPFMIVGAIKLGKKTRTWMEKRKLRRQTEQYKKLLRDPAYDDYRKVLV